MKYYQYILCICFVQCSLASFAQNNHTSVQDSIVLSEVTVLAERPLVVRKADRTGYLDGHVRRLDAAGVLFHPPVPRPQVGEHGHSGVMPIYPPGVYWQKNRYPPGVYWGPISDPWEDAKRGAAQSGAPLCFILPVPPLRGETGGIFPAASQCAWRTGG